MGNSKIGAVLVIGGGIGGVQAALDLADSGFKVYLLEEEASIGGIMAQLDKTFPTNDCSMCILAPKLVSAARHPGIELITYATLEEVSGGAGNFRVKIKLRPRYVDAQKCIGCGICSTKCPVKIKDKYNENLNERKVIGIDYPQAVPSTYYIQSESCIFFTKNRCRICQKVCPAGAVDFEQEAELISIDVGSIIVASGLEKFDARLKPAYGYGRYKNVIKSTELERILNASGPFDGHLVRPSDHAEPKRVAFIQCVGSRDSSVRSPYCSSVCCVYSIKEAILIREHAHETTCKMFYIDTRTFGKGFEDYYERAKTYYGIKFERALPAELSEVQGSLNLLIRYENETGELVEEEFDLVVLAVGLRPRDNIVRLAKICGLELNEWNFVKTLPFSPIATSRPGIFSCGTVSAPKDIPETVIEASAAAGKAGELLKESRKSLVPKHEYPDEKDFTGQQPRIGAFICHCGINIAGTVNVKEVAEYAKTMPNVVYAETNLYSCSDDAQRQITSMAEKHQLNRVVIAACTPRTHEPLFQETIKEKGMNKYLLEFANIRDQCSWVHAREPEAATKKAKDLVRMACARAALLEPLSTIEIPVIPRGLVIGGGAGGLNAALSIANQGFEVVLVEREGKLGGNAKFLKSTINGKSVGEYMKTTIAKVESHPLINIYKNSKVEAVSGFIGNFKTKIKNENSSITIEHGIVIVATGAQPYQTADYIYGKDNRIITQRELQMRLSAPFPFSLVVMIQCVGSRDDERKYCSRVCCTQAIRNAIAIKEINPQTEVMILYRDIRTYGFNEIYYEKARDLGVVFLRFNNDAKPKLCLEAGVLKMTFTDLILKEEVELIPDLVVLSTGIVPEETNKETAQLLKVPLNKDGFFLEAHMKLRPVDFATDGVFLCGLAHSPKNLDESIVQAAAAANRAAILLTQNSIEVMPIIASVDKEKCIGCGICEKLCAYQAHELYTTEKGYRSKVITASCKGCGSCASSCPQQAITMKHFTNDQINAQIKALIG